VPLPRRAAAAVALAAILAGCRIDVAEEAAPAGYHRMADGTLMANVAMATEYRDLGGRGIEVATHTRPDGTVVLGSAPDHSAGEHGGHDHAVPDPADFPQGVVPIRLIIPRIDLDAPVVATSMTATGIQGPPVAGDIAWLEQTRRPGEIGPAIFGGVDRLGDQTGAYAALDQLAPGDEFAVLGAEGDLLHYRVERTWTSPIADRNEIFRAGDTKSEIRLVNWAIGDGDEADHVVSAFAIGPDA